MCDDCVSPTPPLNRRRLVQLSAATAGSVAVAAAGLWSRTDNAVDAQDNVHWEYEGEAGPEHWGELDPDYATCGSGTAQSPIDIVDPVDADLVDIEINYQPISPMKIVNNGHTIQVTADPGSTLTLEGVEYVLQQFHFHQPSEHTINGEHQRLEMHLVHKTEAGDAAVLSVLLREGTGGEAYEPIFANLPTEIGAQQTIDVTVNPADLLPGVSTTYRYEGSLTTPPCTEGVQWLVFTEPVELSAAQVATADAFQSNNRPVQPKNDRPVEQDTTG
jgi:carbonic anhydrase